jgi:TfoX/Sxy family transcriptional regulator of competence genes
MAKDDRLAERIRAVVKGRPGVGEKRMFGGVCFTLNGAMACGTAKGKLMLRVGKERHDEIIARKHVTPMDFTGRPMRGFVYVEPEGYRTAAALRGWVDLALEVAATAPAKKSKRASKVKPLPPKLQALADQAKQRTANPSTAPRAAPCRA